MGNRPRPVETAPYERDHDVLLWQQSANFQYHDGVYAFQGAHSGFDQYKCGVFQVRHRGHTCEAVGCEGSLCVDAIWAVGAGRVEG